MLNYQRVNGELMGIDGELSMVSFEKPEGSRGIRRVCLDQLIATGQ